MGGREGDSVLAAQSEYTIYAKYRPRRLARSCGQSLRIIIFVWHFINYAQMRRSCTHTNTLANNINIYLEILAPIATTHCPSLAYNIVCTYWRIYARMPTPNMPHNHTNVMKKKKMNHSTIYWGDAYAHTYTYTQRTCAIARWLRACSVGNLEMSPINKQMPFRHYSWKLGGTHIGGFSQSI